jgi:hypothetical protein
VLLLLSAKAAYPGQVTLAWDPNTEPDLAGYKVYVGESSRVYQPGVSVGNITTSTITGLVEGRLYYFAVTAYNSTGNESGFSNEVSTIVVPLDVTPPSVSITAPAAGATVSGAVTVVASATDNVGVTQVQILVDGTALATDTVAPYEAAWDTSTVANGPHTLTSVAWDLAGNATTSAAAGVTVANEDTLVIGLGSFPGQGGWLALGGDQTNAFATQLWARVGWDAYFTSNGELHATTGDVDGDGLDEIIVGLGTGGEGWIAVLDDPAHGYQWLRWLQVAWPSYNAANGSVFPAAGDLDGDGRAEIIAGLGAGGAGFVQIFDDAVAGYSHLGWLQVPWSLYNAASGETHPAVADIDGDGRAEIVLGLASGGQGFVEVRSGATGYDHRAWLQVASAQYNLLNGATFPAAGDVDADGRAEIVVGLGQGGGGWLQVFDDATANHVHLRWLQVAWPEYNIAVGETHPAVGNLDTDSAAEIVIGLGRFAAGLGGWFEILDDANAGGGYPWLSWQQVGRDAFEADGGGTFPSVAQQRR